MLRVLLVDDEPLARQRLTLLVNESGASGGPLARVVAEAGDAAQALAWLGQHEADVVLLDVQMPGLDGMALAAKLAALPRPPAVVFVTAHAQHAVKAFELEATDYLTKPVRRERLKAALERVARRRESGPSAEPSAPMSSSPSPSAAAEPALVVTERGRLERVPLSRVLYLKAELKYVTLRTAERTYLLDETLTELEERLGARFLRIHRNAIVARAAMKSLERRVTEEDGAEGWAVCVGATGEWLAVSRRQAAAVREAMASDGVP
jgi:two-component system response regulator AlgR